MPDLYPNLNRPYRDQVQQVLRRDEDILDDLVISYWTELPDSITGGELSSYADAAKAGHLLAQTLFEEGAAFTHRDFWKYVNCGMAGAFIISALRAPLLLDNGIDVGLLDKADAAVEPSLPEPALVTFLEGLVQATDTDKKTVETLYLLVTQVFAMAASEDKAYRKLMGIKKGFFS